MYMTSCQLLKDAISQVQKTENVLCRKSDQTKRSPKIK